MKQTTLQQFLNQPTTVKRPRQTEDLVHSAPSKKKGSVNRMKRNKINQDEKKSPTKMATGQRQSCQT